MESQKSLQQRFNQGDWDEPQIKEKFSDIPSQMLEKYEFFHGIGQGTQGQVFEGRRKSDGAHVAIKKLDIACVSNWKEYELFHREANALAQIDIEGTAHFYEAVEYLDDEHPSAFIVQEFIEGRSLESLIKDGHRFTNAQIYDAALQLIEILKKLPCRENPVIHRDLKPSNVILSPKADGCFKVCLIDFGAVANPQIQSGGSTVAGTYGYMPPEQLMGKPVPASDIYALGALLSHWFSGVDPADMQVADFRLLIEPHLENLPHAVVSTLRNMLTPAVDNRLCDYELLDKAFRSFLSPDKDDLQAAESVLMSGDLEKRFKEVKSLGQTGNIELWHSLSDSVPREIPKCYKKIEPKRLVQKRELVDPKVKKEREYREFNGTIIDVTPIEIEEVIIMMIASFPPVIIYLCVWAQSSLNAFLGVLLPLLLIVFGLLISVFVRKHNKKSRKRYLSKSIRHLLVHGRKSIATITAIEYQSIADAELQDCSNSTEGNLYYYNGLPNFVVSYKFNPPDDASAEDIVHCIVIHTSPEGRIKVGEPLPILYEIDSRDAEIVTSMPVPFAMSDIADMREIICRTKGRARCVLKK